VTVYKPVLRKLANIFIALEVQAAPSRRSAVHPILDKTHPGACVRACAVRDRVPFTHSDRRPASQTARTDLHRPQRARWMLHSHRYDLCPYAPFWFILKLTSPHLTSLLFPSFLPDGANTIYLHLFPKRPPPPEVYPHQVMRRLTITPFSFVFSHAHQVPVRIKDIDSLMTKEWDLTMQQVRLWLAGLQHGFSLA